MENKISIVVDDDTFELCVDEKIVRNQVVKTVVFPYSHV